MDSDESRPGSSASNSSESSNSRPSSPTKDEEEIGSPQSFQKVRSKSPGSPPGSRSSSSASSHDTDSPVKSPINDRNRINSMSPEHNSFRSLSAEVERSRSNSRQSFRSSDTDEINRTRGNSNHQSGVLNLLNVMTNGRPISRNQSISPARKSKSPRSRTNSPKSRSASQTSNVSSENLKPEEISDVEMDSDKDEDDDLLNDNNNDNDDDDNIDKKDTLIIDKNKIQETLNMSHEDLSDVSDLESTPSDIEKDIEDEEPEPEKNVSIPDDNSKITDLRQKLDERKHQLKKIEDQTVNGNTTTAVIENNIHDTLLDKKHDEDALDFEAEEGECNDGIIKEDKIEIKEIESEKKESDGEAEEGEELEEGEVSDEDEKRPEETEPKPVCRFYTRGQCTWGMSCRFLHPGVTDKGNYTMFDMVRPVPVPHNTVPYGGPPGYHDYRNERPPIHHPPPHHPAFPGGGVPPHARVPVPEPATESAWERGLRTAKEMMRKANKRKEQDMDFEDKKMNLSLSQDELEKDNYYTRDRASPDVSPPYGRPPGPYEPPEAYSPPPKFARAPPVMEEDPYGRVPRYRELPPHRMPQYEDERRVRPAREVIVQRAEPVVGRGDEWNDPWMRSKSPGREKRSRRDRRSYSSNSSYSSSSSSRSATSSETSRSPSPSQRKRFAIANREVGRFPRSPTGAIGNIGGVGGGGRKHAKPVGRSPTPPPKRRYSPAHPEEKLSVEIQTSKKHSSKKYSGPRRSPPPLKRPDKRIINSPPPNMMLDKRTNERVPMSVPLLSSNKKKRPSSPAPIRKIIQNQLAPERSKVRQRKTAESSQSGSSDSSASESDSSYSSSSESSRSREKSPTSKARRARQKLIERKNTGKKVEMNKKKSAPIDDGKTQIIPATNTSSSSSKKTTRREELLKQLRAVEDAIARKRSKIN